MIFFGKLWAAAVMAGILFFPGCTEPEVNNPLKNDPEEARSSYITIIAAGDNLIHDIIYNRARVTGEAGRFDFTPNYAPIQAIVQKADIAFVNQETVMGGSQIGYSGYPTFNTPQDAGVGLINAGFTVVNHASNHAMDKGERAVTGTMDFWEARGIPYLGIFRSEEKRNTERQIIEKNGIKTGFLSYTYGLNGFSLPRDKPWLVGVIDKEVMAREISRLRPHCDFLVVSMHWGNEFQHTASAVQKELALFLAEQSVDLIIGHHPHVTQPVEMIPRPDGGNLFVYYSLGDLLSHTQSDWTPDTITGALAYIRVKKTQTGDTTLCTVETAGVIPTVCHYDTNRRNPFVVYPLWDYSDELASKHFKPRMTMEYLNGVARQIFGLRVLDKKHYETF
jgi:poly-gamma-glutamate synthesis protein (capsule biosynthesis protein)